MKNAASKVLTLLLCAVLLLSMSGAVISANAAFIEGKPYDQYTYKEYMALTSAEKAQFYKGFPSLRAFNRWYNDAKTAADEEKVVIGNNSIDLGDLLKVEASIGEKKYGKFTEALNAAAAGDTIVLETDITAEEVIVPADVTLDLAGNILTVDNFGFMPDQMGKITDSTDGKGLLKAEAETVGFLSADAFVENVLPIYDAAKGGYRFYSYTYGNGIAKSDASAAGAARFWYQLQFASSDAYALLYAGNTGVKMGVDVIWSGKDAPTGFLFEKDGSADAWSKAYGGFVLGYDDGTASQNPWLWVRVLNADKVSGLTLTPYVTAGSADIYLKPITYNT